MKYRMLLMPALLLLLSPGVQAEEPQEGLIIEKLTWAGVKMVANDTTVFIDAIGTDI